MTDDQNNTTPNIDTPSNVTAEDKLASRRRLLRIGAKAAPVVVATLAARPSFACHCVAPSAWGSVVATAAINGETGKLANDPNNIDRLSGSIVRHHAVDFDVWQAYQWKNTDTPWIALANRLGISRNKVTNAKRKTIDELVSALGIVRPMGITGSNKIGEVVNNSNNRNAVTILVGQLNALLYSGAFPQECGGGAKLLADVKLMAQNAYPPASTPWTQAEVYTYLNSNWIARGF